MCCLSKLVSKRVRHFKPLRGSKRFNEEAAHVVSAWAAEEGLTLAREFVSK